MNWKWLSFVLGIALVFIALLPALISSPVGASTQVGGPITGNTAWTKSNSPYMVTNSVLVSSGVTLTIEPGVTVKFNSAKGMQIEGQLIALGTELEPILFTSNQPSRAPGDWVNILFTDTSVDATYDGSGNYINGSIMRYCTIEYGGGSSAPMLKILYSSPFIDHCSITHSAYGGIYVGRDSSPKISNSTISNNNSASFYGGGGIYADGYGGTVTINNCTISNNSANGIYVSYQKSSINYNSIYSNTPYDVYNSNSQGSPHVDCTHNWWGTSDEATIQAHIYDWYDDAARGIVDYIPFLTSGSTPVAGITRGVNGDILPGVSITLDGMGTVVSDQNGQFQIMATATGDYTVTAHKDGFRDRTRTINIAGLGEGYAVTCNFQGNYGLIPNAPGMSYALGCINRWLYPPNPDIGLDMWTALAVINAWLYPVQ